MASNSTVDAYIIQVQTPPKKYELFATQVNPPLTSRSAGRYMFTSLREEAYIYGTPEEAKYGVKWLAEVGLPAIILKRSVLVPAYEFKQVEI